MDRTVEVENRTITGYCEADAIESGRNSGWSCLLTLVDRTAKEAYLENLAVQTQSESIKALDGIKHQIGKR